MQYGSLQHRTLLSPPNTSMTGHHFCFVPASSFFLALFLLSSLVAYWTPTADGDCSHEIKRRLLLGRKVMTNLDSMLKSRDITLPTKVCLVKAIVFPVLMYGCESWTVKKAELQRIDALNCGVGEDS